jgi:hypothetical protein
MADKSLGHYRLGNKNARNIYYSPDGTEDNEEHVAVVFDPATGPRFVRALNGGITPELAYALELVESLTDREPCQFDHNHSCQAHLYFYLEPDEQCPMQLAKDLVKKHGFGEAESSG